MKNLTLFLCILLTFFSCNNQQKSSEDLKEDKTAPEINLTTAEKIAQAHGFKNWNAIKEIAFTFNVERNNKNFKRSWIWKPKTGDVTLISEKDTINYNQAKIDSLTQKTDGAFINDKYWLLAPFHLVWDKNIIISEKRFAISPISKDTLQQLTIQYGDKGGYTPGDAYDFFYDENYKIKEWNYRKSNAETISLSTTWEDHKNFNGLKIAKTHKDSTGTFKLYFTNISVKKDNNL